MTGLEALLREAASTGRLTGLTVWQVSGGFQCNAKRRTPDGAEGWCCVTDEDPVAGVTKALSQGFTSLLAAPVPNVSAKPEPEDIFG